MRVTPLRRLLNQTEWQDDCLVWMGAKGRGGYGLMCIREPQKKNVYVHRWLYERINGPLAKDLQLDHLCRNPACVNLMHLEPVSARTNVLRSRAPSAMNAQKRQCKNGHDLNVVDERTVNGKVSKYRYCRICRRAYQRKMSPKWRKNHVQ